MNINDHDSHQFEDFVQHLITVRSISPYLFFIGVINSYCRLFYQGQSLG